MSEYTPNLNLFKYNPTTDGKEIFSIEQALNQNWDILDGCGSPATTVVGSTWKRVWPDGWKEQGGLISMESKKFPWTQVRLTQQGTLGGNYCAAGSTCAYGPNTAWQAFDNSTSTAATCYYASPNMNKGEVIYYTPTPINVTSLYLDTYLVVQVKVYYSDNGTNWTECGSGTMSTYQRTQGTINVSTTDDHKYYKIWVYNSAGASQPSIYNVDITATYTSTVASTVTFPTAFSNTNYSYCIAFEGENDGKAYVNTKTTTGLSIVNSSPATACYMACGY